MSLDSARHSPEKPADLHQSFVAELYRIGDWWLAHSVDEIQGGFYGEIAADNTPVVNAEKGIVLNTRILWFFAEAARFTGKAEYRTAANRAYHYLMDYFFDTEHGGFYWSLSSTGEICNSKKQVYAQAFAVYALSAYYKLTENPEVLQQALACFSLIENKCVDREKQGYLEAYTRSFGLIADVRLSEKDLNFPKTMNTHLHVVEAYTTLYEVSGDKRVGDALAYGIDIFDRYLINHETGHLRMFLDDNWQDNSPGLTYGHDIECSWLLYKAVASLGRPAVTARLMPAILFIAKVCQREAIGHQGDVLDGLDFTSQKLHTDRVWWVQAEALVGFLIAYKLSGDDSFRKTASAIWTFINTYQLDHQYGEWRWHSSLDQPDGTRDYKAGFWKGPYHNGRAMIEAARVLEGKDSKSQQ